MKKNKIVIVWEGHVPLRQQLRDQTLINLINSGHADAARRMLRRQSRRENAG